jgi:hypothetical protein
VRTASSWLQNCPAEGGVMLTLRGVDFGVWGAKVTVCKGRAVHSERQTKLVCELRPLDAKTRVAITVASFPLEDESNALYLQTTAFEASAESPTATTPLTDGVAPTLATVTVAGGAAAGGCVVTGPGLANCPRDGGVLITLTGTGMLTRKKQCSASVTPMCCAFHFHFVLRTLVFNALTALLSDH